MAIVQTKPARARASRGSPPPAAGPAPLRDLEHRPEGLPACSFCRKNSDQVKFAIIDPADRNNICETCADECVRVFACTCVC
jgi:hypothetical protein